MENIHLKSLLLVVLTILLVTSCEKINTDRSKKALLVVSFGSSFKENREASIDKIEAVLASEFSGYDKFNAYTSQMIIDVYADRDNVEFLNVSQAIESIYKQGYGEVLVVPTHVINGEEYDQMLEALEPFMDKISDITISKPVLTTALDYEYVVNAIVDDLPELGEDTAVVLMGHGTHHHANSAYPMLDYIFKHSGYKDIYVGTVEGTPDFNSVLADLKAGGYKSIYLRPLMIVAGDHAHNDMAGEEAESWNNLLKSNGFSVSYDLKGLGEYSAIQNLLVEHAKTAVMNQED